MVGRDGAEVTSGARERWRQVVGVVEREARVGRLATLRTGGTAVRRGGAWRGGTSGAGGVGSRGSGGAERGVLVHGGRAIDGIERGADGRRPPPSCGGGE